MHTEEHYLTAVQGLGGHSIAPVLKEKKTGKPTDALFWYREASRRRIMAHWGDPIR